MGFPAASQSHDFIQTAGRNMDPSIGISIISAIIASASAIYARRTWNEAKLANEIALHVTRKAIYKAFDTMRHVVMQRGELLEVEEIAPFHKSCLDARFYFSEEIADKLKEYFDVCFQLALCRRKLQRPNIADSRRKTVHKEQDSLWSKERQLAQDLGSAFDRALSLGGNGV